MSALIFVGDALWILALAIMAGASLDAWKRIPPDVLVPSAFRPDGTVARRAKKTMALLTLPVTALVVSLLLVVFNRNAASGGRTDTALILFGVRALAAALFALAHLRWVKAALDVLRQEGSLRS
jgi:hypothetical protein